MAADLASVSAWKQSINSMSRRHETSRAWHGCREYSSMCRKKMVLRFSPRASVVCVLIRCHSIVSFQDMIISGLQPETSYSLTVTAYTTKGDGARSKPKLVSTTGAGNPICPSVPWTCYQVTVILIFQMVWVDFTWGEKMGYGQVLCVCVCVWVYMKENNQEHCLKFSINPSTNMFLNTYYVSDSIPSTRDPQTRKQEDSALL